jgi:serine/threonine protein kinase/tetratricopeptide (TPR) repeat protein
VLRWGFEGAGAERTLRLSNDALGESAAPELQPSDRARGSAAGMRIARYEVLEAVGSGAMGTLYRARDPQLARDIALKLLHDTSLGSPLAAEGQAQLLREAQVLARLSHPNVVAAYDIGSHDGAVFIAMEFIEGMTLRDWLLKPRARRDVLRVLIAAGDGLVAAHAAGVLHRDFKPANVMVSSDGRVRVIDFGLARAVPPNAEPSSADGPQTLDPQSLDPQTSDPQAPDPQPSSRRSQDVPTLTLTRSGTVMGTPGYISHEQLLGAPADHRSDQFSFAVTAFVALTGQLPYPSALGGAQGGPSGARTIWPRSIPRALRRIIDRGLAPDPERRYPSLATMVRALERFASPRRQRAAWLALAGTLAAAVALVVALPRGGRRAAACNVDDTALRGVWDSALRGRVERAFRATGQSNAVEVFQLIARRLDTFAQQWMTVRRGSCEATFVRGEQPERVLALRAGCLDRALEGTKALVTVLAQVAPSDVDTISQASPASLTACSDVPALLGVADRLPADPSLRAIVDEVAVGLVVNEALIVASRGSESIEQARKILDQAQTSQHLPTIAAATAQLGRATHMTANTSEQRIAGEQLLSGSIRLAAEAGDERLVARTSSYLFNSVAYFQQRTQEAEAMFPVVDALVQRAGNYPLDRVLLLLGQSTLLFQNNRLAEAQRALEEAIRLSEDAEDDLWKFGISAATDLGHIYVELGRFAEAEAIEQRALDDIRRQFGAQHPRMMSAYGNLSTVQAKAGHRDQALASIAEYRRIAATMPPSEPRLRYLPLQESRVWRITGDCARAVPLLREALVKFSSVDGPDHPRTMVVVNDLGVCLAATDNGPEALSYLEQALANRRQSGDVLMYSSAFELAKVLWSLPAQRARARSLAEEALAHWKSDGSMRKVDEVEKWLADRQRQR